MIPTKSSKNSYSPLFKTLGTNYLIILLSVVSLNLIYQPAIGQTLHIGDSAPAITPFEWIKGGPIPTFKPGKIYVVEMGATWCKPCIAAIPELTRIATKYRGKVEVISLFVQELNREALDVPNPKYVEEVKKFVEKRSDKIQYHVGVDDPHKTIEKAWIEAMGKGRGIPQTFVVDQNGNLAMHTNGMSGDELDHLLQTMIDGSFSLKAQIASNRTRNQLTEEYNYLKPLFVDNNGGDGSDFVFRSIISRHKGRGWTGWPLAYIRSYHSINNDSSGQAFKEYRVLQGKVETVGSPLAHLYYLAYADTLWNRVEDRHPLTRKYPNYDSLYWFKRSYDKYWPKPLLEVADTVPFSFTWFAPENRWTYALNVPDKKKATAAYLQKLMREDLDRFFSYEVKVETRSMPCWYLKAYPRARKLKTKTPGKLYNMSEEVDKSDESGSLIYYRYTNADTRDIIALLARSINSSNTSFTKYSALKGDDAPFVNQTNIDFEIDFDMTSEEKKYFDNQEIEGIQKYLNRLGFYLEKGEKPMKVVVIRDTNN